MRNVVIRALCCLILLGSALALADRWRLMVAPVSAQTTIQLQPFVSGLAKPVFVTSARDGSNRLFIIEQSGRILVMLPGQTTPSPTPFLDITAKALAPNTNGSEQGLLGLAFHPQFKTNRRFFVNYTRKPDGATVVAQYRVSTGDANVADVDEVPILTVPQPFANHNGGMLDFGKDGYLYIGMGDGGSSNDPGNRAQNVEELLGKILRIDPDTPTQGQPYSSPPTNPFFGPAAGRDEVYAYGLRNPWRWSFDRTTGELYAGDVGQGVVEEIDLIQLGKNYGWRILEGTRCTNNGPASCTAPGFTPPIHEYMQQSGRCSVTGGYVYRGTRGSLPAGSYVFGDYCTGEIFLFENGAARLLLDSPYNISSFGEDEAGELYVVHLGGAIYRIVNLNAPAGQVAIVSAASYRGDALAPELITAAFGTNLAVVTQASNATPLPANIGGTQVTVRDSTGVDRIAPLFFVSPNQVNYQIPPNTASGNATVTITNWSGVVSRGTVQVSPIAPGLFTLNATGRGLPAAVVDRIKASGTRTTEAIGQFDPVQNQFVPVPIDLGALDDQVFLVLFGTGFRFRSALSAATATIGGTNAEVTFAGPQGGFVGLDQANIRIPRSLAGRGEVDVVLTVDGQASNAVRISLK
ncbi:MAG: PQQ-dependent sugar dehydrogenase [Acidobacteriota bacterium]|nr:PQQ-dependent sugar dehydrogenase [Acidobacteriota bacterium]